MTFDLDGARPRYFHERAKVEAQAGAPLHQGVSSPARARLYREIESLAWQTRQLPNQGQFNFMQFIVRDFTRVLGAHFTVSETHCVDWPTPAFLTFLEISAAQLNLRRRVSSDIRALQSILADDLSSYRFREVGTRKDLTDKYQIQLIDNEHLHTVITDRTFELTRIAQFASAQADYADAWKHYSMGDLDDAVSNAGKAVESACKAMVKKVDPTSTPDNLNLAPLVALLVARNVIPSALTGVANHLEQIFRGSGALRNQAGTGAHGSVDLTTPEAAVALLGLRLSGTLISFLAERWEQMKPAAST